MLPPMVAAWVDRRARVCPSVCACVRVHQGPRGRFHRSDADPTCIPSRIRMNPQEQNCIAMCMDRYIETMNVVQHTLSERSATR